MRFPAGLAPGRPGKFGEVRAGRLVLDGDIIAPADGEAMVMRRRIAGNGVVVVAVDGLPVQTPEMLAANVNQHGVGDSVELLVFGNGRFR